MKDNSGGSLILLAAACILGGGFLAWGCRDPTEPGKPAYHVLPADLVARATELRERALTRSKAYDFLAALTAEGEEIPR